MDETSLIAFADELEKIGGLRDLFQRFLDIFRTEDVRNQRKVDYFFSPKAGADKWDKFVKNVRDPQFVKEIAKRTDDEKLQAHAQAMHNLSRAKPLGKIQSARLPGRTYEIRAIPGGLGCTCPDWRFKGSVTPGYECKHIRAYKEGKAKAG